MENISVYTLPPSPPKWDRVGIFYISFCVTWTTLVLSGMVFCWFNRHSPIMRLRGLPLSFTAIAFLHAYWILAQITYPIGGTMPIVLAYDIQYFFMGLWFPLGIALFHASNSRFLYVAKMQKQFTDPKLRVRAGCNGAKTSLLCRLRNMPYSRIILIFIRLGMVAQVLLTVGMWLACRKYHPTYGIPGTEIRGATLEEQIIDLGRGWEWWPSVLWQVVWTWIVAPFLIWRAWGIRDTMGWRTQTIGCCLSNLHATPMFLIASYVPAFAPVNMYYPPSQWIHLSIMMFEVFTIFVPVFQLIRLRILSKQAADSNARWENSSQATTLRSLAFVERKPSSSTVEEKGQISDFFDEEMGDRLLTMGALEQVLNEIPGPLQEFSALSDFSGENIAFLTRTAAWKSSWLEYTEGEEKLNAYNHALEIYTDFISPQDAEFPLNLSSQELKHLEEVFEKAARIVMGETHFNLAIPFERHEPLFGGQGHNQLESGEVSGRARYTGEIPLGFSPTVFNNVQSHIKYLVLTNTWPKFVREMQQRRRSSETGRSETTATSQVTLAGRVLNLISSLL